MKLKPTEGIELRPLMTMHGTIYAEMPTVTARRKADFIRYFRRECGLTLRDFAATLGVSVVEASRIERGLLEPEDWDDFRSAMEEHTTQLDASDFASDPLTMNIEQRVVVCEDGSEMLEIPLNSSRKVE